MQVVVCNSAINTCDFTRSNLVPKSQILHMNVKVRISNCRSVFKVINVFLVLTKLKNK
jgi:hypothetical protein